MGEDRFDRIEQWQSRADARFDRIEDWQSRADARFERIDDWQSRADERFERMDTRLERVEQRLDGLDQRVDQLDNNMHVLHEDVMSRLKAMPEQVVPTRSEMMEGCAEIKEMIGRRLDPLEAVVKQHSKDIQRLRETGR